MECVWIRFSGIQANRIHRHRVPGLRFVYTIHTVIYPENKIIPINSLAKFMHILSVGMNRRRFMSENGFLLSRTKQILSIEWYLTEIKLLRWPNFKKVLVKMVFISVIKCGQSVYLTWSRLLCMCGIAVELRLILVARMLLL